MIKAKFKLPKLTTKKLWAGLYGGHYDTIVFFKEKPTVSEEPHNQIEGDWYECSDNNELIIGNVSLGVFYEVFPDADISEYTQENGRPKAIEIPEVFEIEVTTVFDEYGNFASYNFDEDGWN